MPKRPPRRRIEVKVNHQDFDPRKHDSSHPEHRKMKDLTDELVANFTIKNFDYSPDSLNELYDALNSTRDLITGYYESASGLPPSLRETIANMHLESDLLFLKFNELYVRSNGIIYKAKKKYLSKEEVQIEKSEVKDFLETFKRTRKRLKTLIFEMTEFLQKLRKSGRGRDLML
jgi:hypothetical protein